MVTNHSSAGLIATTRADVTPPLDELVTYCGWPVLLSANPRRLAHEMAVHDPDYLLFWLESSQDLSPTAQLVEWTRARGNRPLRIAVALQLEVDAEAAMRSAGAHGVIVIPSASVESLSIALRPLLGSPAQSKTKSVNAPDLVPFGPAGAADSRGHPGLVRPP